MADPNSKIQIRRPLLQRRNTLISTLEALLDGSVIILIAYFAFTLNSGILTSIDIIFIVVLMGVMSLIYDQTGVYRRFTGVFQTYKKLLFSWSLGFFFTLILFYFSSFIYELSSTALNEIYFLGFTGQAFNRFIFYRIKTIEHKKEYKRKKCVLIGDNPLVTYLHQKINANPWVSEHSIGHISVHTVENAPDVPVVGNIEDIREIVQKNEIKTVYITVSLPNSKLVESIYETLVDENVDIHWAPNIFNLELVNHSVKEIAGIPLLTLSETPLLGNNLMFKAIEDRILALISLIIFSPLMLVIGILIKLETPGPVFFRQSRTGFDGKSFFIWKFRSMKVHQEQTGKITQATKVDDRITRMGRFIRKTSIDELPQLFNVMTGEMSMVGPRPHADAHTDLYSDKILSYMARHRIKPGITGLAQIHGYRGETDTIDKMEKRIDYDLRYINNWSIMLDFEILLKTVPALLRDEAY